MIFGVMLGGALGAASRYLINLLVQSSLKGNHVSQYPIATLIVNLIGSFILSCLFFSDYFGFPPAWKTAIGTGFVGALTTFSTYQLESFELFQRGEVFIGSLYLFGSLALGLTAVLGGRWLALQFR